MANANHASLGVRLSKAQIIAGFLYLPFYVVLLAEGLNLLTGLLDLSLTDVQFNACWFILNAIILWAIFHKFLLHSLRRIRFWDLVQACILGFVFYYFGTWLFGFLTSLLNLRIISFNDETVQTLVSENYWVMVVCSVAVAPIIEETLVRGLIFGAIHPKSRIAAYVASILFFSIMHVWAYLPTKGLVPVLLAAAQYIPASIALGWTYEKAKTVWAPIIVHMTINAISMSLI